jgi:hypothetical protein
VIGSFCSVMPWIAVALMVASGFVTYRGKRIYAVLLALLGVATLVYSSHVGCGFIGECVFYPSVMLTVPLRNGVLREAHGDAERGADDSRPAQKAAAISDNTTNGVTTPICLNV